MFLALTLSVSAVFSSCSEGNDPEESVPETVPAAVEETGAAAEETEADRIDVLSKSFTRELQSELGLDGYETNILLRLEGYE